jgi:hypothetical protein
MTFRPMMGNHRGVRALVAYGRLVEEEIDAFLSNGGRAYVFELPEGIEVGDHVVLPPNAAPGTVISLDEGDDVFDGYVATALPESALE